MAKLRHDLRRLQDAPGDPYTAFDFFVTAEHMPEWMGLSRTEVRNLRKKTVLLRVVSHIANGAKHFQVDPERHHSVSASGRHGGYFPIGYFHPGHFHPGHFPTATLYVALDGEAAAGLGAQISAVSLADQVLEYWTAIIPAGEESPGELEP